MRTIHGTVPHHTIDDQACRDVLEDGWLVYEEARDNPDRTNAAHAAATKCLFATYGLTNRNPAVGRFARRAAREVFARCVIETYRTRLNPMARPWETVQLELDALKAFVGLDPIRPLDGLLNMLQSVGRPYLARGRVLVGTVADADPDVVIAYRGRRFSMETPRSGRWQVKHEHLSIGAPILFTTTGSRRDGLPLVSAESGTFLKNAAATLCWPTLDNHQVNATLIRSKGIGFISGAPGIVGDLDRANILSEIAHLMRLRHVLMIPDAAQQVEPIRWYATHIADRLFPNNYRLLSSSTEGVMIGSGGSPIPDALLFDFALMLRKLSNQPRLSVAYARPHGRLWAMRVPTARREEFRAQDAPPRSASNGYLDRSAV